MSRIQLCPCCSQPLILHDKKGVCCNSACNVEIIRLDTSANTSRERYLENLGEQVTLPSDFRKSHSHIRRQSDEFQSSYANRGNNTDKVWGEWSYLFIGIYLYLMKWVTNSSLRYGVIRAINLALLFTLLANYCFITYQF